jgi:hypothetical protein
MRTNGDREAFPANMQAGLTKRELLAGLALAGLLAGRAYRQVGSEALASEAVVAADALLGALGQSRELQAPVAARRPDGPLRASKRPGAPGPGAQ